MIVYCPELVYDESILNYVHALGRHVKDCSKSDYPLYEHILYWAVEILYGFLPFALLFIFNIIIGCRLLAVHKMRKQELNYTIDTNTTQPGSGPSMKGVTVLLMMTSLAFLILTTPYNVYFLMKNLMGFSSKDPGYSFYIRIRPYKAVAKMLQSFNHAVNFVIYCLSGPRFRREMINMFCSRVRLNSNAPKPKGGSSDQMNDTGITSISNRHGAMIQTKGDKTRNE